MDHYHTWLTHAEKIIAQHQWIVSLVSFSHPLITTIKKDFKKIIKNNSLSTINRVLRQLHSDYDIPYLLTTFPLLEDTVFVDLAAQLAADIYNTVLRDRLIQAQLHHDTYLDYRDIKELT